MFYMNTFLTYKIGNCNTIQFMQVKRSYESNTLFSVQFLAQQTVMLLLKSTQKITVHQTVSLFNWQDLSSTVLPASENTTAKNYAFPLLLDYRIYCSQSVVIPQLFPPQPQYFSTPAPMQNSSLHRCFALLPCFCCTFEAFITFFLLFAWACQWRLRQCWRIIFIMLTIQ